MKRLEKKVALVTGSSRGIGAAVAKRFAEHGAQVAIHGRDQDALSAVNCIAPETILTERNRQEIPASVQYSLIAQHPIRRLGVPEEVADAALFLASDEALWISGVILDVAGGAVLGS